MFFSCGQNTVVNPSKDMVASSWKGSFKSDYHTDGIIIYWYLLKDGTMTGKWETNKGSSVINVEGVYQIIDGHIKFHAGGTLVLYNNTKTGTQISGKGILGSNKGKGTYQIEIEHPNYPNDNGTWEVIKI
jgi:hypothetical protein